MSIVSPSEETAEPFPQSGLASLVLAAAADAGSAILFSDDEDAATAADVAMRVEAIAARLRGARLVPHERVLVVTGAQVAGVVALAAALRAGLEPVLVPAGAGPADLAAFTHAAGAVALIGPSRYGAFALADTYLSAAAAADSIRMIATLGPEPVDGALDLSTRALSTAAASQSGATEHHEASTIATIEGPAQAPSVILHRQAALFADALALVEHARINPSRRILSTLPPATMAGLVAGPFAALVGASGLRFHGPFDAPRFLALCDSEPGFHLVAPVRFGSLFDERRLSAGVASLILVSRFPDAHAFALPATIDCDRPIVDVYAFGEDTLLARRRTDGEARPPARITDKSPGGGLGARLNRARAEIEQQASERT